MLSVLLFLTYFCKPTILIPLVLWSKPISIRRPCRHTRLIFLQICPNHGAACFCFGFQNVNQKPPVFWWGSKPRIFFIFLWHWYPRSNLPPRAVRVLHTVPHMLYCLSSLFVCFPDNSFDLMHYYLNWIIITIRILGRWTGDVYVHNFFVISFINH